MKNWIAVAALALTSGASLAYADDTSYDTRSLGMGGTGVTTSNAGNAAFQNPSMLASSQKDSFALQIPMISVRQLDENNLHSDISSIKSNGNALTNAIQAFQANPTQANAGFAATAINNFNNALAPANNKSLLADVFAGTMLGVPGKIFAFSLYLDVHAEAGVLFKYSANDQATLSNLSNALAQCAANSAQCPNAQTTVNSSTTNGQVNNLQSQLLIRGVKMKDVGITAAHHFDSMGDIDLGITPKVTQLTTYDYALGAQQAKLSLNQGEKSYSALNMDIGGSKSFKTQSGSEIKAGMVVKNMFSQSYATILGNTIDIKPQAAIGASYVTKLTTTGIDLDVIPNKPVISGYSKESQFVRLGAEFDAWRWAQVRVGFRHDLKGNYPNLPSIGLGLSPLGLHIDLSAAYANQKEFAASMQVGINF